MSIIHGVEIAEVGGQLRVLVGPDADGEYAYGDEDGVGYVHVDLLVTHAGVAVTFPDVPDVDSEGFYDNPATGTLISEDDLDEVIADGAFALAVKAELEAEVRDLASELRTAYYNDGEMHSVSGSSDPGVWLRMARAARAVGVSA